MTERPILFNGEMVRAILDGRKTQTRRPIPWKWAPRLSPSGDYYSVYTGGGTRTMLLNVPLAEQEEYCRDMVTHGRVAVGDALWVRETWAPVDELVYGYTLDSPEWSMFRADGELYNTISHESALRGSLIDPNHWRPPIHMPRWASRITLEVTGVRAERLQDMTQGDASAEGAAPWWNPADVIHTAESPALYCWQKVPEEKRDYLRGFRVLWDAIYTDRGLGWDTNPFVWTITFKVATP